MEDCVFCKIIKKEIPAEIVKKGDSFIAFKDNNPLTEGHALVVPKQHWVTLLDIPDKYGNELLKFTKDVTGMLMDEGFGDGFNIVMNNLECAGQVVNHAHIHVMPRKEGDGIDITGRN